MVAQSTAIDFAGAAMSDLVTLARGGHRQAVEHIITRCNQRLYRVARAVMNDDFEAEDALQETYIRGFGRLESFRGDAHFTTWLTRILLNECYGRLRKRREVLSLDTLDSADNSAHVVAFSPRHDVDDPINSTGRIEVPELLEDSIASLADEFRIVFVMREVEGYSTEETASMLGIKSQTVKTRLFRARRMLRQKLDKKLHSTLTEAYPFLGPRCANFTAQVMRRLEGSLKFSC